MSRFLCFCAALSIVLLSGCGPQRSPATVVDPLVLLANAQKGSFSEQRRRMIAGIRADLRAAEPTADTPAFEQVLTVMGALPRERFVPRTDIRAAYVDLPQPIGQGQTISDPYIVALMTAALNLPPDANVLDVGTGSGYQAAVLARIARRVWSDEILPQLARTAAQRLRMLGITNVEVRTADGFLGWPEHAPFDGIIVAASAPAVPSPLLAQLKPGGRLIMPVGPTETSTQLLRITKRMDGTIERCSLGGAFFVPLTGPHAPSFAPYGLFDRSIPHCFGAPIVSPF